MSEQTNGRKGRADFIGYNEGQSKKTIFSNKNNKCILENVFSPFIASIVVLFISLF